MKLSKNSRGIAHLAIFIVFAVTVLGFVGYTAWNAWRADHRKNGIYSSEAKLQESLSASNIAYDERVIFPGSLNEDARNLGDRIKNFYVTLLKEQKYDSFLTDGAKAQLKQPRSYSIVACGQVQILIVSISEPKIRGNTASANIKLLQYGQSLQDAISGHLDLVKSKSNWLIDNFGCSL